MVVIETDLDTLSVVKLYCDVKGLRLKDFVCYICEQNDDFRNFKQRTKRLKL